MNIQYSCHWLAYSSEVIYFQLRSVAGEDENVNVVWSAPLYLCSMTHNELREPGPLSRFASTIIRLWSIYSRINNQGFFIHWTTTWEEYTLLIETRQRDRRVRTGHPWVIHNQGFFLYVSISTLSCWCWRKGRDKGLQGSTTTWEEQ